MLRNKIGNNNYETNGFFFWGGGNPLRNISFRFADEFLSFSIYPFPLLWFSVQCIGSSNKKLMDNLEKLATYGIQDDKKEEQKRHNTICAGHRK